jgi:hypothetical protein
MLAGGWDEGPSCFGSVSVPVAQNLFVRKVRRTYGLESDDSMAVVRVAFAQTEANALLLV